MTKLRPGFVTAVIVTVHAMDVLTFWMALTLFSIPISAEANPLAVMTFSAGGFPLLVAYKLLFVSFILFLLSRVTEKPLWPPFLLAYFLGIVGTTANLLTIHGIW